MPSSPELRFVLRRFVAVLLSAGLTAAAWSVAPIQAGAAPSCGAFTAKVYDQLNPTTQGQSWSTTAAAFVERQSVGFTSSRPTTLAAAPKAGVELYPVHRLHRASTRHYFFSLDTAEIARAVKSGGYVDQGVAFYAAKKSASCLVGVVSYYHPTRHQHRFTGSTSYGSELVAAGWVKERVRFYLGKAPSTVFTIGVLPDTQRELWTDRDQRFAQRTGWLVSNKSPLGTVFATHTGDIVDWDTPNHEQYVRARAALAKLNGQLPYSVTIGNHDTAAVGVGGSAADPPNTWKLVRDTTSANRYLNQGTAALAGQFEAGKIDNTYHLFTAGGRSWMVLNLELWPRREVINWANSVVKAHPRHNVIVATHSFLQSNGTIYQRSDYGATSPQYLYDHLLKVNRNVKVVLSGHTGASVYRELAGAGGNKIHAFLLCMHDEATNPVRLLEIDTAADTIASAVYAPYTKKTYPSFVLKARPAGWLR